MRDGLLGDLAVNNAPVPIHVPRVGVGFAANQRSAHAEDAAHQRQRPASADWIGAERHACGIGNDQALNQHGGRNRGTETAC